MKINGKEVVGKSFAYDGCHKIYICEEPYDEERLSSFGYSILPLSNLQEKWETSCDMRLISNASLTTSYVVQGQGDDAVFDFS